MLFWGYMILAAVNLLFIYDPTVAINFKIFHILSFGYVMMSGWFSSHMRGITIRLFPKRGGNKE